MSLRQAAEMALEAFIAPRDEKHGRLMQNAIKALRAALAESDEPVAWRVRASGATGTPGPWRIYQQSAKPGVNHPECCDFAPLYTHPPRREPLTEDDIDALAIDTDGLPTSHIELARAVERAHGIGGDE